MAQQLKKVTYSIIRTGIQIIVAITATLVGHTPSSGLVGTCTHTCMHNTHTKNLK